MPLRPREHPSTTITLGGLLCAGIVAVCGWGLELVRLGVDEDASYRRVERLVTRDFDQMTAALSRIAIEQARFAATVFRPSDAELDLRPLFSRADHLLSGDPSGRLSVTVYGADGAPLAWAGRPSERLPPGRGSGPASLFVAPGPLGYRLVRTEPVVASGPAAGGRLGTVAAERVFSELAVVGEASVERIGFETPLAPVFLRTRYEGAGERSHPYTFLIRSPSGEPLLEATVDRQALQRTRQQHRRTVWSLVVAIGALTLLVLIGRLLERRTTSRTGRRDLLLTVAALALLVSARLLVAVAAPVHPARISVFSPAGFHWPALGWLARHPADFLLTALAALGAVALLAGPLERWRHQIGRRPQPAWRGRVPRVPFLTSQAAAGVLLAAAVLGYERLLAEVFGLTRLEVLYFSPQPWDTARVAMAVGLVCGHAALAWALVLFLRLVLARWRVDRRDLRTTGLLVLCWGTAAAAVWGAVFRGLDVPFGPAILLMLALAAVALFSPRSLAGLRHASQGYRLFIIYLGLFAPAAVVYPSLVHYEEGARRRVVETTFGPEVLEQRETLESRLRNAQHEIDSREPALAGYVAVPEPPVNEGISTDSAFEIWRGTALEHYRVSSAIELYNAAGRMVSRFALNLPEDTLPPIWREEECTWQTYGEVSRFGAHERQLLHGGRNVCAADGTVLGTIVIKVVLDHATLSFISSQNPYFELLRGERSDVRADIAGRTIEFAVYGWSRTPLFTSGTSAWPIDDRLFDRILASRQRFWTRLTAGTVEYDVFIENDRAAIYALGYPVISRIGHLTHLAELASLSGLVYVALLLCATAFRLLALRRPHSGRTLLDEVRRSFSRKVFLAFVAAAVVPVVTLALTTRAYIADRLRYDVEVAADKTTAITRQMLEEYVIARQMADLGNELASAAAGTLPLLTDDEMVRLSRVIGQDVNVFAGARLVATSERDLFASGLLPARTPARVYRGIVLDRLPAVFTEEATGAFRYLVAAAPVRVAGPDVVLTVPLTLRQQEIEREIHELNRRIVLAAMLFIVVGAAIGYRMADRIADPVNRLMRATRRIGRGDFDARVTATSSDELRRLVEAFNSMSAELQRQRGELERTNRLEAWAEMARQVAHEIKNPLTPIQLSAEHLRRVHADRGRPLEAVLDDCVESILSQVRLLRQIASEFSSFASQPTARLAPTDLHDLVEEVARPYVAGVSGSVVFQIAVPADLPPLFIDRALVGRALTNVIDNALHAMPGGGALTITARLAAADAVGLTVEDTGVGMDDEALARLFEPYFSTKAVGTGLGLAIARRNLELNRGSISVTSRRGAGTRVAMVLPTATTRPENRAPAG